MKMQQTHPFHFSMLLLVAGCSLALVSVFAALPFFNYGVWFQSEPVIHINLLATALVSAGLALGLRTGVVRPSHLLHPIAVFPLLIALYSALVSPWALHPQLSWLGNPELGQGVVSWVSLSVMIMGMRVLLETSWQLWLVRLAGGVCGGLTILYMLPTLKPYQPYDYPDHLAFYALTLPVLASLYAQKWKMLAAYAAAAGMVIIAQNQLAMAMLAVGGLMAVFIRQKPDMSNAVSTVLVMALPLLLVVVICVFGNNQESSSLWSRVRLWEVAQLAFADNPSALATGFGWGHYAELTLRYLFLEDVRLFTSSGALQPNWEGIAQTHFHSHNLFIEALLSGGVICLLLVVGWLIAGCRYSHAEGRVYLVMLAGLSSGWFQLPGSWPFMALALAISSRNSGATLRGYPLRYSQLLLAAVSVGMAGLMVIEADMSLKARQQMEGSVEAGCENVTPARGYAYLAELVHQRMAAMQLSRQSELNPALQEEVKITLCMLESHRSRSIRIALLDVILRTELAYMPHHVLTNELSATWGAHVEDLLQLAPYRTDMAAPYLFWLMQQGQEAEVLEMAQSLHAARPEDAVALWFMGNVLMGDDTTAAQGVEYLRHSLRQGIDKVIPVPEEIKRTLEQQE